MENYDSNSNVLLLLTADMKHMKYETDFCHGKVNVVLIRMQVLEVLFGISQYQHCIVHPFEELQNQLLLLALLLFPMHSESEKQKLKFRVLNIDNKAICDLHPMFEVELNCDH